MSDITDRLRQEAVRHAGSQQLWQLLLEAIDVITKLEQENARLDVLASQLSGQVAKDMLAKIE